jgi:formylglycine-generating enzyme required for sulfatase activity
LARLNRWLNGLELSLPSEAQWEYACRAGTMTATYAGDLEILGQNNAPVLEGIAWYGGNCGVGFDLAEGVDTSGWVEKQYDFGRGGTRLVGQKRPNDWGLHDMLGNVSEWCADAYGPYGGGEEAASADRVVRGGSWDFNARHVRAASRNWGGPGYRVSFVGFRCAEFRGRVDHTLARPPWARAVGRDRFGLWAELRVADGVVQRLRWIPPGRFLMGSPQNEAGRDTDEIQHEETIERGFWMFDTPCTQAVWEAVMGGNPSRFRSPTRPVEQVTWHDCKDFLARLNGRLEGLELSLPSEAQWEYACRAGTTTATYVGDLKILGLYHAPVLDGIAWYGGNCGVGFDLAEGVDTSGWREKQYDFGRGGTRPVGQKRPNDRGLYDMLGNVWEWCADAYRSYRGGQEPASADRVLRGGSWVSYARYVRAAYRHSSEPGSRDGFVGFRCAEFSGRQEPDGFEPASDPERVAEPRGGGGPARPAGWLRRILRGRDENMSPPRREGKQR